MLDQAARIIITSIREVGDDEVFTPHAVFADLAGSERVAPSGVVADGGGYAQANRSAADTPVGAHNESQSSLRFGAACEQAATAATTRRSSAHGSTGGVSLFAALSSARASLEAAKQETLQMQVQGMGEQYISRARLLRRSSHAMDESIHTHGVWHAHE